MRDYDAVIRQMTLHEKVMLCTGKNSWRTQEYEHLDIPSILMSDGTSGVRFQKGSDVSSSAAFYEKLSGRFDDENALQQTYEATAFPSGSAIACSWNKELIGQIGESIAKECQSLGINLLLGPGVNIRRHPLTARNFEYYSEDPCLAGEMAAAVVNGIQSQHVGTCTKHFACHNSDTRRTRVNVLVSERALREIYLAPFECVVKKADPTCIMSAYNQINGEECGGDARIVKDILRKEWGFDGAVICDWGSIKNPVEASLGGIDLQMPRSLSSALYLEQEITKGRMDEAYLDERVKNILKLVDRLKGSEKLCEAVDFEKHHRLAQEAAGESAVLLKNENNLLPLSRNKKMKVAVIGKLAKEPLYQGTGCAIVNAKEVDIPWDSMLAVGGDQIEWCYAAGYLGDGTTTRELLEEACNCAKQADAVLAFVGTFLPEEDDDFNRKDLQIEKGHAQMLEAVTKVHTNVAVILSNGDVCELPWAESVKGILDVWYSGEGMGAAVAKMLFGDINPSGKLSVTIPMKLSDTPAYLGFDGNVYEIPYNEDIYVGYRYYDKKEMTPRYPFGYGLSYTSFAYQNMTARYEGDLENGGRIRVSVEVTNTGSCQGQEVIQLYVSPPKTTKLPRAIRELKAFEKISLMSGETKTAAFELTLRDFQYYDPSCGDWAADEGDYRLEAAASSRDVRISTPVKMKGTAAKKRKIAYDCGFYELFETEEAKEKFYQFLVGHGLITKENIDEHLERSLRWAFWPVWVFLDMNSDGVITYEMFTEFIDEINCY